MKTIYEMTVQELLDAGFNVYASKLTTKPNPWERADAQKMEMLQGFVPSSSISRGWFNSKLHQSSGAKAQRMQGNGARLWVAIS